MTTGGRSPIFQRLASTPGGNLELIRESVFETGSRRAIAALSDVSRHIDGSRDMADFLARMSRTVADLMPCGRVAFWMLDAPEGLLRVQPGTWGVPFGNQLSVPCRAGGAGVAERIVHHDWILVGRSAEPGNGDPLVETLQRIGAHSSLVVAWRAGDELVGAISALDAHGMDGFTADDAQLLKIVGLGTGLAWQRRRTEDSVRRRSEIEGALLRAEAERMSLLEQVKSDFLKLASHELRAPVSVVRGYLSMISDGSLGEIGNPQIRGLVPMLEGKLDEIDHLVGEMLETARLDDRKMYLRIEIFDLCELLRESVRSCADRRLDRHPIALLLGTVPVLVRGDRERVEMIVANLLGNAIKYSPEGGDIDVVCSVDQDLARVSVGDHGLGIAEADMARLFTRFGRIVTEETSSIPGTGLGLYLARELARLHGGDLTASSTLGEGSQFLLTIPRDKS